MLLLRQSSDLQALCLTNVEAEIVPNDIHTRVLQARSMHKELQHQGTGYRSVQLT